MTLVLSVLFDGYGPTTGLNLDMFPYPYRIDFFYNLSYKLSGTYNLVNQVSKKNMFSQKQVKLAKKQIWNKANLKPS